MKLLDALRAKAEALIASQKALAEKEVGGTALTEAEVAKAKADADELADVMKKIAEAKKLDDAEKAVAALAPVKPEPTQAEKDVTGTVASVTQTKKTETRVEVGDELKGQAKVGMFVWCAGMQKLAPQDDPYKHLDALGYTKLADMGRKVRAEKQAEAQAINKTLLSASGAGANTVFTPLSNEFIEFLYNSSAFLAGQPLPLDLSSGSLNITGGNASATASYGAEGANISYSEMTTRQVNLSAKHLRVITAVSRYLNRVSPLNVAMIAGDNLAEAFRTALDSAGLRGDGTSNTPTGLRNLIAGAAVFAVASGVAPTYTAIETELKKAVNAYRTSNVPMRRPQWIMSNRVAIYLENLRDANGNPAFKNMDPESTAQRRLKTYPVILSEQVPSNLGAGTNESEIYLQDFGHVYYGVARALELAVSEEASYINAGSTMVSTFAEDSMAIRAVGSHDFDVRHTRSGAILSAVQWGA